MKTTRSYQMRARADATEQTRRRILSATFDLANEKLSLEIVLGDVAARAGVSVQTVLRHFGSRDGLFEAVARYADEQIRDERAAPVGDIAAAIDVIFDHYELRGDMALRLLAQELWDARARSVTTRGRELHRRWVTDVFAPQLLRHPEPDREALIDLLVIATDVYTWKLLRRDRALGRGEAQARVRQMIDAVLATA